MIISIKMTIKEKNAVLSLSPSELYDVCKSIQSKLNSLVGTCTEKDGYVVKIIDYSIIDNIISRAQPVIFFNVKYKYEVFNPGVGDVLECKIVMIFQVGIWTELTINGVVLCIAIPSSNTALEWNGSTFGTLTIGDMVSVLITNINFDKNIKKYIGKLLLSETNEKKYL